MKKTFDVAITDKGSQRAKPAIWYAGMAGRVFKVARSIQWPSVYQVCDCDVPQLRGGIEVIMIADADVKKSKSKFAKAE